MWGGHKPVVNLPRILCVDDSVPMLSALQTALTIQGFDVVTACHGLDGLRQFEVHHGEFHSVITDHDMPGMNGVGFVQALRARGYRGRIILISGNLGYEDLVAYKEFALGGFFHKPFDLASLGALLWRAG